MQATLLAATFLTPDGAVFQLRLKAVLKHKFVIDPAADVRTDKFKGLVAAFAHSYGDNGGMHLYTDEFQ